MSKSLASIIFIWTVTIPFQPDVAHFPPEYDAQNVPVITFDMLAVENAASAKKGTTRTSIIHEDNG
jgi:hypothetical protein